MCSFSGDAINLIGNLMGKDDATDAKAKEDVAKLKRRLEQRKARIQEALDLIKLKFDI
jgi:hypothetical protein